MQPSHTHAHTHAAPPRLGGDAAMGRPRTTDHREGMGGGSMRMHAAARDAAARDGGARCGGVQCDGAMRRRAARRAAWGAGHAAYLGVRRHASSQSADMSRRGAGLLEQPEAAHEGAGELLVPGLER